MPADISYQWNHLKDVRIGSLSPTSIQQYICRWVMVWLHWWGNKLMHWHHLSSGTNTNAYWCYCAYWKRVAWWVMSWQRCHISWIRSLGLGAILDHSKLKVPYHVLGWVVFWNDTKHYDFSELYANWCDEITSNVHVQCSNA